MTQILEPTRNRIKIRDFGTCLNFNGTNAYVTLGSGTLNIINSASNKFTITGWVKDQNVNGRIFSEGNTSNNNTTYDIICAPTDHKKIQIWIRNDATSVLALLTTTSKVFNTSGWTFIAYTDDNGTVKIYADGELKTANDINYTRSGTFTMTTTRLGGRAISSPSSLFRGSLDDFRFYKGTILTQDQIQDLFYTGKNPIMPNASYLMDEGSGTSLIDSSGNGYTGTITNATYSTDVAFGSRNAASNRQLASNRQAV